RQEVAERRELAVAGEVLPDGSDALVGERLAGVAIEEGTPLLVEAAAQSEQPALAEVAREVELRRRGADAPGVAVEAPEPADRGAQRRDGDPQARLDGEPLAQRGLGLLRLRGAVEQAHATVGVRLEAVEHLEAGGELEDGDRRQHLRPRRLVR